MMTCACRLGSRLTHFMLPEAQQGTSTSSRRGPALLATPTYTTRSHGPCCMSWLLCNPTLLLNPGTCISSTPHLWRVHGDLCLALPCRLVDLHLGLAEAQQRRQRRQAAHVNQVAARVQHVHVNAQRPNLQPRQAAAGAGRGDARPGGP